MKILLFFDQHIIIIYMFWSNHWFLAQNQAAALITFGSSTFRHFSWLLFGTSTPSLVPLLLSGLPRYLLFRVLTCIIHHSNNLWNFVAISPHHVKIKGRFDRLFGGFGGMFINFKLGANPKLENWQSRLWTSSYWVPGNRFWSCDVHFWASSSDVWQVVETLVPYIWAFSLIDVTVDNRRDNKTM